MPSSNNKEIISRASPHTIKKFELIEEYIKTWAQKLMLNDFCNGLIFIDCMCNSGLYYDDDGNLINGTPLRVAKILRDVAGQYPSKQVFLYFNDIDENKIGLLKEHLPENRRNFTVTVTNQDGNELLKNIGSHLSPKNHLHYFLLYDPYDASIDWAALFPFFRYWGEVMITHMVSDPVRAITQVKKEIKKEKYENTYLAAFEQLVPFGSDKKAYERRVKHIIERLKGQREYYVAAFPFYNTQNSQVYSLIHCTGNREGYKLYKKSAWKTFGARSSTKHTQTDNIQLTLDLSAEGTISTSTDESCFVVTDIAKYLDNTFSGKENIPLKELWELLDNHPVFPSEGYRNEIKSDLRNIYGAVIKNKQSPVTGKKELVVSFPKGKPQQ